MSDANRFEIDNEEYFIKEPDSKILSKAQAVYTKTFRKACDDGAILKNALDKHMRDQGLWNDSAQTEYETLLKESANIEYRIKNKEYKKKSELVAKGMRLREIRAKISELLSTRTSMDSVTAEGQADQERFAYLVSACVCSYKTQKPVFVSVDEYNEQATTDLGAICARKFANYMYGLDDNFESTLLENRLLKRLNVMNDDNQLINQDGLLVDDEGNLLNEDGARIDKEGNRIDINNNPILDDNIIDELEFEDDSETEPVKPAKTTKKSRAKKQEQQPVE